MSSKHYWVLLGLIVVFAFITRIYQVGKIQGYIFDEVYHAVTAKLISRNDPRAYEWWNEAPEPNTAVDWLHPPLAKYTQAASMLVFGETPFGWRFSSVVFGTLVVLATALLADELFADKNLSLIAAALAALDGLLLVQSRIAMNDIHVTFFILLTFLFYLKFRKSKSLPRPNYFLFFLTGLCAGLACASKWSGVFGLGVVIFFEAISFLPTLKHFKKHYRNLVKAALTHVGKIALFLVVLPGFIYVSSYLHMFIQGKSLFCELDVVQQGTCFCEQTNSWWVEDLKKIAPQNSANWEALEARGGCKRLISHFSELHKQIWWYQTNLKATHSYQSRPWQWFLDARPVWMYVNYENNTIANIYAQGNPILFWAGDIAVIASVCYLLLSLRRKRKRNFSLFFVIVAYFAVWALWEFSPRIMFFYHYTPAVPLLCIILSYWLMVLKKEKRESSDTIFYSVLFATFLTFIVFYPNWTGIQVPQAFAQNIYFIFPKWK